MADVRRLFWRDAQIHFHARWPPWILPQRILFERKLDLLAHFVSAQPRIIRLLRNFIVFCSLSFEVVKRLKRLSHGRRFQHPRSPDETTPKVGYFSPIRLQLRLDTRAATNERAERCNGRDCDVIWRTLQPVGNVVYPRSERGWHKVDVKRINGC
jgi:hypothetical protein